MKKFTYNLIKEDVLQGSQPQQNTPQTNNNQVQQNGAQMAQMSSMTPEDANKISMLNKELYKLASEKDQLYLKISNIQKNITDIKTKYNNNNKQAINTNNPQNDISANIMECYVKIIDLESYINEDERPANIIEFNDNPTEDESDTPQQTPTQHNIDIQEKTKKVKSSSPQLNVDEKGKTEYIESDKNEEGVSIYVKFKDEGGIVLGKIYKVNDTSDWETKVIKGKSDTFEEMAFVKNLGVYGVLDKMEGFYDDVNIVKDVKADEMMSDGDVNEGNKPNFKYLSYE